MIFLKKSAKYYFAVLLLFACATRTVYYENLNTFVAQRQYGNADNLIETSKDKEYNKKSRLVYYLDKAYILHLNGEYKKSNEFFEKAKRHADLLFKKTVAEHIKSVTISEAASNYYGEDFERAQIHVFEALNYVFLGQENEALVEARQVDHFLKTLTVNHGHKNIYKEDAFARYIMGMLYENRNELNDAHVSYLKALKIYKKYKKYYKFEMPKQIISDCIRTAKKLGMRDRVRELKKKWKAKEYKIPKGYGELIVLHYNGIFPEKINHIFEIAFGKAWPYVKSYDVKGKDAEDRDKVGSIVRNIVYDEQIRMAFPKYSDIPYEIQSIEAKKLDESNLAANGILVNDLGAIAKQNLDDRVGQIKIRTIVRATLKFLIAKKASEKVEEKSGKLSAWLVKKTLRTIANETERADLRCWRLLPDRINLVRMPMPQGSHKVKLEFKDRGGNIIDSDIIDVKIRKNKKTFKVVRTAL